MVFSKRVRYISCVRGTIQRVGHEFVDICHNGKTTSIRIKDISKIEWLNCNPCIDEDGWTTANSHAYYDKMRSRLNNGMAFPLSKLSSKRSGCYSESSESSSRPVESSSVRESSSQPVESSSVRVSSSRPVRSSSTHTSRHRSRKTGSQTVQLTSSESVAISTLHSFESREQESQENGWESSSQSGSLEGIEAMLKQHVGGLVRICLCGCDYGSKF